LFPVWCVWADKFGRLDVHRPRATGHRPPATTTQTGPPRPDPPQGEATPEIEPVDRDAISYRTVVGGGEGRIIVIENRQDRSNKL